MEEKRVGLMKVTDPEFSFEGISPTFAEVGRGIESQIRRKRNALDSFRIIETSGNLMKLLCFISIFLMTMTSADFGGVFFDFPPLRDEEGTLRVATLPSVSLSLIGGISMGGALIHIFTFRFGSQSQLRVSRDLRELREIRTRMIELIDPEEGWTEVEMNRWKATREEVMSYALGRISNDVSSPLKSAFD